MEQIDIRWNYFKNKVNFATYLVNKFGEKGVEIIKVIKLIFLADVYSLRNHSMLVSEDKYVAMANGPVVSEITNILTQNKTWLEKKQIEYIQEFLYGDIKNSFSFIFSKKNADNYYLSVNGKKILAKIFSEFGNIYFYCWSVIPNIMFFPSVKNFPKKIATSNYLHSPEFFNLHIKILVYILFVSFLAKFYSELRYL